MIIKKRYKFYAAHRNETLTDKCCNLHGHRYGVQCYFDVVRKGDISTLFGEFDEKIEPLIKTEYDHSLLINKHDPLYETLVSHMQRTGENLRLKIFERPTSVENLSHLLFTEITELGFPLQAIEIQETDTSIIYYTREDWVADNALFEKSKPVATSS